MKKKLRLLVTRKCPWQCEKCCNKNFSDIEKFDFRTAEQYGEVMLTGGEPMLEFVKSAALTAFFNELGARVYFYSARCDGMMDVAHWMILIYHHFISGITFTVHEDYHIEEFMRLDRAIALRREQEGRGNKALSLRLNQFDHFDLGYTPINDWEIRPYRWRDDCEVPYGEDLRIL